MSQDASTILRNPPDALPEDLSQALSPVTSQLAHAGETVTGVRIGPSKPAADFLDFEGVRLRLAQEKGGNSLPGQANLVERLRTLPADQPITYVIVETAARQAKCYVDPGRRELLGVLWLPASAVQR
jgi:hypothetical protein